MSKPMKPAQRGSGTSRDGQEREPAAARMIRSRGQLATAYAPGALFTFEGGLGACLSLPDQNPNSLDANISEQTGIQIHLRLRELWQSWLARAMEGGTQNHPSLPSLCLDSFLLSGDEFRVPPPTKFQFVDPKAIAYVPAPLDFVCNTCGRFRKFDSVKDASTQMDQLAPPGCDTRKADQKGKCRWRQLDVIFVHWSGHWNAPTPGRWEWSTQDKRLLSPIQSCAVCQSQKFYLNDKSPRIGEWVFECENGHKDGDSWLQNDRETTQLLGDNAPLRPPRWRRMEPISYRATPAFYPHAEQFIILAAKEQDLLQMLQAGGETSLAVFAAEHFGLGAVPPSDEQIVEMLRRSGGHEEKVNTYDRMFSMLAKVNGTPMAQEVQAMISGLIKDWKQTPGLIPVQHEAPKWLTDLVDSRVDFGSRYDPLVLAVEHEALLRSKINAVTPYGGRSQFVRFTHLDRDLAPRTQDELLAQQARTTDLIDVLGMAEMGLIREFDLCRFTHGFTRMSTDPLIEKKDAETVLYPVRLRLFPEQGNGKIPIYVITQANEAFYVRLNPAVVYEWLRTLNVSDLPDWNPEGSVHLGAHILSSAKPFGKYFSALTPGPANTYRYVYTLLHTYAHTVMKAVAEFSGLDVGSLGEYLFPADLAFVVYRNGTTMDLGNLSALWRNFNTTFLQHLLEPRTLMCGSGSLCDANGGACPSCIVIPETACVAGNWLLSRSVMRGGYAPREDADMKGQRITGFLDVATARWAAKAKGSDPAAT